MLDFCWVWPAQVILKEYLPGSSSSDALPLPSVVPKVFQPEA